MIAMQQQLRMRLGALVIFRGLLQDPVFQALDALLAADEAAPAQATAAWGEFCARLFGHTVNWTDYLLEQMAENENLYVLALCQGRPSPTLDAALASELEFLQQQGYNAQRVAVERNGEIVRRSDFEKELLRDEDTVEVVTFVGGG